MRKLVYYFHGSPGFADEWDHIWKEMNNLDVTRVNRYLEPTPPLKEDSIIVGYSFGCYLAVREAVKLRRTQLVLVCPYWELKTKMVQQVLVNLPIVGEKILGILAPKALEQFSHQSCYPHTPPTLFTHLIQRLKSNPSLLRWSILEKRDQKPISFYFNQLSSSCRITLVVAEQDRVAPDQIHIKEALREVNKNRFAAFEELRISDAGHGLPWTHSQQLVSKLSHIGG